MAKLLSTPGAAVRLLAILGALMLEATPALAAQRGGQKWVATWSASATAWGGGSVGSPVAQPDLSFALPAADTHGAVDQTIRMVVKPDLWGRTVRLRFSNVFGDRPVSFARVSVALHAYAGNAQPGTTTPVTFGRRIGVTIPKGERMWSDAVTLPWASGELGAAGRKLLVSVAVQGRTGPVTWHGKALTTTYLTPQGAGDRTRDQDDAAFPYTSTSWFFLDAVDVMAPSGTVVVAAFGDSITDGTASTINGDDRWSNVLSRRLHQVYGDRVVVVNQGIGGNTVERRPQTVSDPAVVRLERDVLGLSGLTHVVWLEGINDVPQTRPEVVIGGYRDVVGRLHAAGVKVIGATVTSPLNPTLTDAVARASNRQKDDDRKQLNIFIRTSGLFDAVADMDAATLDPATGAMKAAYLPPSSVGGRTLDWLHPNRAGYQAMGESIDLGIFAPPGAAASQ